MDFWNGRDFSNWNSNGKNGGSDSAGSKGNGSFGGGGSSDRNASDKSHYEEKFNEYQGRSEDELTAELLKTAAEMKKEGKLNVSELEAFCSRASAFLSEEQLSKMRALIGMLK